MSAGSNLPFGVSTSDIPGNSLKDAFIENYLDTHIDELLSEFMDDPDREELIDELILNSPAYDEYIMSLPFDVIDSIGGFIHDFPNDVESIVELSDAFQAFADRKANNAWMELCEYRRDSRREED